MPRGGRDPTYAAEMEDRRLESSGDPGHSGDEGPTPWRAPVLPYDARQLGLDSHTEEGAWVQLASSLDSSRVAHRLTAWVLLFVIAGFPVLIRVLAWLHGG